jgi:hypothetical protein
VYAELSAAASNGEFEGVMISIGTEPASARALEIARLARGSASITTVIVSYPSAASVAGSGATALVPPALQRLKASVGHSSTCTFAMCRLGLPAQEYTSLWYTNDAARALDQMAAAKFQCNHREGAHPRRMGGAPGSSASGEQSTSTDRLDLVLAAAFNAARTGSPEPFAPPSAQPPLPTAPAPPAPSSQGVPLNPDAPAWTAAAPLAAPAASPVRPAPPSPAAAASPVDFSGYGPPSMTLSWSTTRPTCH